MLLTKEKQQEIQEAREKIEYAETTLKQIQESLLPELTQLTHSQIVEIVNSLEYFDPDNLQPLREKLVGMFKDLSPETSDELRYRRYIKERYVVNRLLTVERGKQWEESTKSEFYKGLFKYKIINTPDEELLNGELVPNWGVKMSAEHFLLYTQVYDDLFELHE